MVGRSPVPERPDLDHLAIALERHRDALPRYAGELGGTWVSGGFGLGFAPAQVRYANGMKVELLAPYAVDKNDFLRRFLDRRGPGPHHLTFKVPDLAATLEHVEDAGYTPTGTDLRDAEWKETFLHPKQAFGIVVQIAEAHGEWNNPPPSRFPDPAGPPATLARVVHGVGDLGAAVDLFEGLLAGTRVGAGADPAPWVELAWPSGGCVRFVTVAPATTPDGVVHVEFAIDDPARVSATVAHDDGTWTVAADDNYGVALVVIEDRSTSD
jgi:Glyoxalase/Bleomycin resistance protein/Dioxygenase superfamily